MLVAVICRIQSLRDLCALFHANVEKHHQLGLAALPNKSTLSYVNKHRSHKIFEQVYDHLIKYYHKYILDSTQPLPGKGIGKSVKIIDSTVVGIFSSVLRSTGRYRVDGKKKGGIKLHMSIEEGIYLPRLHYMSEATEHDQKGMEQIPMEKGSIYIMDRGYLNYERFAAMSKEGIYFVSRLKENTVYKSVEEKDIPDSSDTGILKDEIIQKEIKDKESGKIEVVQFRRVAYWDDERRQCYEFVTNLLEIEVDCIPQLYRYRWRIELLFKQLKQNFMFRYFLGDNENAIKVQIWCCLIANLLMMVIYERANRGKRYKKAFSSLVNFVRLHVTGYIDLEKCWAMSTNELLDTIKSMWERDPPKEIQLEIVFV